VLLWSGGLSALQTLVIIVAGPFMLVIVAMCASLMKALRAEPYESTLPTRVRKAVLHAQRHDLIEQQTVALAALGAEPHEPMATDPIDPTSVGQINGNAASVQRT
jgi:choline-glycine betaine transporter